MISLLELLDLLAAQEGQTSARDAEVERRSKVIDELKPRVYRDGNKWCALAGEDVQSGTAGFGDTPELALLDLVKNVDAERAEDAGRVAFAKVEPKVFAALERLSVAALGLSKGEDWNSGTHAKTHGHRDALVEAVLDLDALGWFTAGRLRPPVRGEGPAGRPPAAPDLPTGRVRVETKRGG